MIAQSLAPSQAAFRSIHRRPPHGVFQDLLEAGSEFVAHFSFEDIKAFAVRTERNKIRCVLCLSPCNRATALFTAIQRFLCNGATVLVDQSLKARVFAKRVPDGIELENRDGDAVWSNE